jgi:hypothetical protein
VAGPLTFLRSFRHDAVRAVLLVESAPIALTLRVAGCLRTLFPEGTIDAVIREDDREAAAHAGFARVLVVRWEDRREVVRELRRRSYDVVAVPSSRRGSDYLRVLPLLLRTRRILVFNDNLDYFPLHATRLGSLAYHMSGQASPGALVLWALARLLLAPLATVALVASTIRLELRGMARRLRA